MQTLRRGSLGPQVRLLQRLLNLERRSTIIAEDGSFGPLTDQEVKAFQSRRRLTANGVVSSDTWQALRVTIDIQHRITLFPQPTNMTCWSAAATMLFGDRSVGPGAAAIAANGGLPPTISNIEAFARSARLTMHYPANWTVQGLADMLRRGPLWMGGLLPLGSPTAPNAVHVIVVGAMWGNGSSDGTMLKIYDPWPPGAGSVYSSFHGDRIAGAPLMTLYILHR